MEFGGPFFPFANFWAATSDERNVSAGAHFRHEFSPRVRLELNYDYMDSHSVNRYDYASLGAIPVVYAQILDAAAIGSRFPANVYRTHELAAKLDFTLSADTSVGLFCKYQRGEFTDWHLAGFDTPADLVIGNRVFTELAPQADWDAMVLGVFITTRL